MAKNSAVEFIGAEMTPEQAAMLEGEVGNNHTLLVLDNGNVFVERDWRRNLDLGFEIDIETGQVSR